MDGPDEDWVAVNEHVDDGDDGKDSGERHEDDGGDHAWNQCIPRCILEVPTDQEEAHRDANEPNEWHKAELEVVGQDHVEILEVGRFHFGVQALVREEIGQVCEATGQCDVEKEDEASDSHHHMEHVFISLSE